MKHWLSLALLFFGLHVHGQIFTGSVSSGIGGAGRAAVEAGDSGFLNPATLAHLRGYYFYSGYVVGQMALGISDNTPESIIPTAFGYFKREGLQDLRLSVADFITRRWSVGVNGHYFQSSEGTLSRHQFNADLGVAFVPSPQMGLGLVFYNLLGETPEGPMGGEVSPQVGVGFNYVYRNFVRWRLDVLSGPRNDFKGIIFMGGLETYMNRWILLRLGFKNDNFKDRDYLTAGLGFDLPRFKLNYSYEGNTKDTEDLRHTVDLSVPF